jgi:hypothetical protein
LVGSSASNRKDAPIDARPGHSTVAVMV